MKEVRWILRMISDMVVMTRKVFGIGPLRLRICIRHVTAIYGHDDTIYMFHQEILYFPSRYEGTSHVEAGDWNLMLKSLLIDLFG